MKYGCSSGVDIGPYGGQHGIDGRTDIPSEDHSRSRLQGKQSVENQRQSNGHGRAGRMYDNGDQYSGENKNSDGKKAEICIGGQKGNMIGFKGRYGIFHEIQTHEKDTESDHEFAPVFQSGPFGKYHGKPDTDKQHRKKSDLNFESKSRHNPSGNCRTDVGSHNYSDRLLQCKQTGIDETDGHYSRCGRGLNNGGYGKSCKNSQKPIGRYMIENLSQTVAGRALNTVAHGSHSIKEKPQSSQQLYGHYRNIPYFRMDA